MSFDVTNDACCEPQVGKTSWRSVLKSMAAFIRRSTHQNKRIGVSAPLPEHDANAMADIGLSDIGIDQNHPAIRAVRIHREFAKLAQFDRFGR